MKNVFCNLILGLVLSTPSGAQTKHALIFAIGNYPAKGGWPAISSLRDVPYIKSSLLHQEFQENNIQVIADAQATMTGISNAFSTLIKKVRPGEVVVIHFSCHGAQVEDDNNDETDGLDETIVTYNAVAPSRANKKDYQKNQAGYFRDDQLDAHLHQLRKKLGKTGDVAVFLDFCNSGSGTRDLSSVRGGELPLVSEHFIPKKFIAVKESGVMGEENSFANGDPALASLAVFSATRADELNGEIKDDSAKLMGPLSYAVNKAFENLEAGTTYRSLFAKIRSVMEVKAATQHPVLEGSGTDRILFGGKFVYQKPYVGIKEIHGRTIILDAGLLAGLNEKAGIAVYPSGTADRGAAKALAHGTIIKADNYSATAQLEQELPVKTPALFWVFITDPVYAIKPVVVGIVTRKPGSSSGFSQQETAGITTSLKSLSFIQFGGRPELVIVKGRAADSIKISSNGYLFKAIPAFPSHAEELQHEMQRYAQYKFLQSVEIKDAHANVEVRLVPLIKGRADTSQIRSKMVNGAYEFSNKDTFVLWVNNRSPVPVYMNALDIQPDGMINPVLPRKKERIYPEDLIIAEGSSLLLEKYTMSVSPPYGMEILKIFVSRDKIDMEEIIASQGKSRRGNLTALEDLVNKSFEAGTEGFQTVSADNTHGSAYTIYYRIKP